MLVGRFYPKLQQITIMKIDLLYYQPMQNFLDEAAELGFEVSDASDFVHASRVEIRYPENKQTEYYELLNKHGLHAFSMKWKMS